MAFPCGYRTSNILFIASILVCALSSYLVRLVGIENLDLVIQFLGVATSTGGLTIQTYIYLQIVILILVGLNNIYLKFLVITKVYYLIRYTNGFYIPSIINRILYLLINGLFILLISVIILKNDFALISTYFLSMLNSLT